MKDKERILSEMIKFWDGESKMREELYIRHGGANLYWRFIRSYRIYLNCINLYYG